MNLIYIMLILSFILINLFLPNSLLTILLNISIIILYLYFEKIDSSNKTKIVSFLEKKETKIEKYINLNITVKILQIIFALLVIYSFYKIFLRIL